MIRRLSRGVYPVSRHNESRRSGRSAIASRSSFACRFAASSTLNSKVAERNFAFSYLYQPCPVRFISSSVRSKEPVMETGVAVITHGASPGSNMSTRCWQTSSIGEIGRSGSPRSTCSIACTSDGRVSPARRYFSDRTPKTRVSKRMCLSLKVTWPSGATRAWKRKSSYA